MRSLKLRESVTAKVTTEDPALADRFDRVLSETVKALEESHIRYAFIGGIASSGHGRPRSTRDIDLLVRPEDALIALRALAKHEFRTEETDPSWLYKGFKEEILVDVIFRSKGEIYLDQEMFENTRIAEFHGQRLRLVGPEDLCIIKAAAHSEPTPNHWHDAIAIMASTNLDWRYLIRRARRAPRRVLSLFLYAQSVDVWVPNYAIQELYSVIFGDLSRHPEQVQVNRPRERAALQPLTVDYGLAHFRSLLAENPSTNELDIQVEQLGNRLLLRGEVSVQDRKEAIEVLARERFPNFTIENQIRVLHAKGPSETEEVK